MRSQVTPRRPAAGVVGYASAGRLLITGPLSRVRPAAEALHALPHCTVLITAADDPETPSDWMPGNAEARRYHGALESVEGYLGRFEVQVRSGGGRVGNPRAIDGQRYFDLLLDLTDTPAVAVERRPMGYYAPGRDARAVAAAIDELGGLVGEFEKPVYIRYDTDLCAHGASGRTGCTRCLDACPTGAIASIGERIEVDTHLCHGVGACATACPTGALGYAYPERSDLLAAIDRRLAGVAPGQALLLYSTAFGERLDGGLDRLLPEWALPLEVEEVAAVGAEAWLTALALGADQVVVLAERELDAAARTVLDGELRWTGALLEGLGQPASRIVVHHAGAGGLPGELPPPPAVTPARPLRFSLHQDKRTTLWLAIDALWQQSGGPVAELALPAGSPVGNVTIDVGACTLCMACVSVCPSRAMHAGGDRPLLSFVEQNCVQCGLCVGSCPERALALEPRIRFDAVARRGERRLKEEAPFECITCGKAFASQSAIAMMVEKLQHHSMFQGGRIEQLKMCEDCRVRAVFEEQQRDAAEQGRRS